MEGMLTGHYDRSRRWRRVAEIIRDRVVVALDSRAEEEELLHCPCDLAGWPV